MCASLERKAKRDQVTGAINGMRIAGMNETDIVTKIMEAYSITKDYVMALLKPQVAC